MISEEWSRLRRTPKMIMKEEFARCEKCDGAYFEEKTAVLVVKGSPFNQPLIHKRETGYICMNTDCGHIQYKVVSTN